MSGYFLGLDLVFGLVGILCDYNLLVLLLDCVFGFGTAHVLLIGGFSFNCWYCGLLIVCFSKTLLIDEF